jgi:murein DD-endopeptidase MepM/ murein hydrolase activator NlpD
VAARNPAGEAVRDAPVFDAGAAPTAPAPAAAAPASGPLEPKPLPPLRTARAEAEPPPAAAPDAPDAPAPAVADTERATAPEVDAAAALTPPALSGVGFLWPVPAAGEAVRISEVGGEGALAIQAPSGEPFVAAENGVVVFAGDEFDAFGRMVVVRHDGDYATAYGHAARLDVAVGDVVRRGQKLGLVGTSGAVATPQLHFEMRVGSRVVDPRAYLVEAPRLLAEG